MIKNLYRVIDTKTRTVIEEGFEKKKEAKVVRNEYNEKNNGKAEGNGKPRYVIARDTDHIHGITDGFNHKNIKKNRRQWLINTTGD